VLKPLGADAKLDPQWAVLSGFGGWRITGADYLTFLDVMAPENMLLGETVKRWAFDREDRHMRNNGLIWYGLGMHTRKAGDGYNVWHAGRWRYNQTSAKAGALTDNFGSFAIRYRSGVSVFIAHRPSVEEPGVLDLQRNLSEGLAAVRNWN
jgi:hypothetical protein